MADYVDLDYSMEVDEYNTTVLKTDAAAVKQSMIDILLTKLGEREFMPLYGSKIYQLLMEKINYITKLRLHDEILLALRNWEPRIEVNKIDIESNPEDYYYDVFIYFDLIRVNQSEVLELKLKKLG